MTDETKGDLAHFLIALALDADKQVAFRQDPQKVMEEAGLTQTQMELVRSAVPYLSSARTGSSFLPISEDDAGGKKTIVVVVVIVVIVLP